MPDIPALMQERAAVQRKLVSSTDRNGNPVAGAQERVRDIKARLAEIDAQLNA